MPILSMLASLFAPAAKLIDNLHTSEAEKLQLTNELAKIQLEVHKTTTSLMTAEAQSPHMLTAIWRPLCSLGLVAAILMDGHFGFNANEQVYSLANIFLGVYRGSRGLEKIAANFKK